MIKLLGMNNIVSTSLQSIYRLKIYIYRRQNTDMVYISTYGVFCSHYVFFDTVRGHMNN